MNATSKITVVKVSDTLDMSEVYCLIIITAMLPAITRANSAILSAAMRIRRLHSPLYTALMPPCSLTSADDNCSSLT